MVLGKTLGGGGGNPGILAWVGLGWVSLKSELYSNHLLKCFFPVRMFKLEAHLDRSEVVVGGPNTPVLALTW